MQHGIYVGSNPYLKGKFAILRDSTQNDSVLAQFDNIETGLGYGWTQFPKSDFNVDKEWIEEIEE